MTVTKKAQRALRLPGGLTATQVRRAAQRLQRDLVDFAELCRTRAFPSVVAHFGAQAIARISAYETQQAVAGRAEPMRAARLVHTGRGSISAHNYLESKGSKRPWAIQSHYDHPGWYIVWRYLIDPTQTLAPGKPVVIWRVDVVFLQKADWKYEKSTAGEGGGGRTHTFGVKEAARKLAGKAVYRRKDVIIRDGKPITRNGHGEEEASEGSV